MKKLIQVFSLSIFLLLNQNIFSIDYENRKTEIIANRLEKLPIENTNFKTYGEIIYDFESITDEKMICKITKGKCFIFTCDILEYSNSKVKLWSYINWNDINTNIHAQDIKYDKIIYRPNYKESANIINIRFKSKISESDRFTIDDYIKWKDKNLFSEVIELYTN